MRLALNQIRRDGGTQPRTAINEAVVSEYGEMYREHGPDALPAVTVFFDSTAYWLADGFHRTLGAERAELKDIDVDVRHGTQRDAILWSFGANASHGLRRTNDDKRKAVHAMLADAEWSKWSDSAIARACSVSHTFVQRERASLATDASEKPAERTYTTKHGTEATMKVGAIGKGKKDEKPAAPPAPAPAPEPPAAETPAAPPAEASVEDRPSMEDLLGGLERDLAEAEAKVKSLSNTDTGAEILRLHQMLDHANRKADEAQGKLAKTAEREAWNMKQLRRCGKAVGEDDPAKIAPKVEALARATAKA